MPVDNPNNPPSEHPLDEVHRKTNVRLPAHNGEHPESVAARSYERNGGPFRHHLEKSDQPRKCGTCEKPLP